MKFYKKMLVGESIKNPTKVKRKLKLHAGQNIYVIALSDGNDSLEIYHCGYLKQPYYRKHPPIIIGIAANHGEAVGLITELMKECVAQTANCNLKEYLVQKASEK